MQRTASSATRPAATGTWIGVCTKCDTRYFAGSAADRGYTCTTEGCDPTCTKGFRCLRSDEGPHTHGTIRWSDVKGRVSAKHACDAACLSAQGTKCVCACGGANHGWGLARFEQGLAPRSA